MSGTPNSYKPDVTGNVWHTLSVTCPHELQMKLSLSFHNLPKKGFWVRVGSGEVFVIARVMNAILQHIQGPWVHDRIIHGILLNCKNMFFDLFLFCSFVSFLRPCLYGESWPGDPRHPPLPRANRGEPSVPTIAYKSSSTVYMRNCKPGSGGRVTLGVGSLVDSGGVGVAPRGPGPTFFYMNRALDEVHLGLRDVTSIGKSTERILGKTA